MITKKIKKKTKKRLFIQKIYDNKENKEKNKEKAFYSKDIIENIKKLDLSSNKYNNFSLENLASLLKPFEYNGKAEFSGTTEAEKLGWFMKSGWENKLSTFYNKDLNVENLSKNDKEILLNYFEKLKINYDGFNKNHGKEFINEGRNGLRDTYINDIIKKLKE